MMDVDVCGGTCAGGFEVDGCGGMCVQGPWLVWKMNLTTPPKKKQHHRAGPEQGVEGGAGEELPQVAGPPVLLLWAAGQEGRHAAPARPGDFTMMIWCLSCLPACLPVISYNVMTACLTACP